MMRYKIAATSSEAAMARLWRTLNKAGATGVVRRGIDWHFTLNWIKNAAESVRKGIFQAGADV